MKTIVERSYRDLVITQDLGLGMMLWMTCFFPEERWARVHRERSLAILDRMWIDPPGYFCRELGMPSVKFAFTNFGVSLGLQAVEAWPERVARLNSFFEAYRSGDEYDTDAITHVMACCVIFPRRVHTAAHWSVAANDSCGWRDGSADNHSVLNSARLLLARRFGSFWIGSLLSNLGTWMQQVAEPWIRPSCMMSLASVSLSFRFRVVTSRVITLRTRRSSIFNLSNL